MEYIKSHKRDIFKGSLLTTYIQTLQKTALKRVPQTLGHISDSIDLSEESPVLSGTQLAPAISGVALDVWKMQQQLSKVQEEVNQGSIPNIIESTIGGRCGEVEAQV